MLRCTKDERQSAAFLLEDGRKVVLGVEQLRGGFYAVKTTFGGQVEAKRWRRLLKTSEHF